MKDEKIKRRIKGQNVNVKYQSCCFCIKSKTKSKI